MHYSLSLNFNSKRAPKLQELGFQHSKIVKRFEKILGETIYTVNRVMVFQKILTSSIIINLSVSKIMFILRHLQRGKKIRMHVNRRDQKEKKVPTKENFSVITV